MNSSDLILGENCEEIRLSSEDAVREAVLSLAVQARYNLKIFSHDLESMLYDNDAFINQVSRIATSHRNASIDVLIQDPMPALKEGHRLVTLSQRLSSTIHIRRVSKDFADNTESFMMADDLGILFRSHKDRWQGWVNANAGPAMARWTTFFDSAWELAEPEQNFRRLHL